MINKLIFKILYRKYFLRHGTEFSRENFLRFERVNQEIMDDDIHKDLKIVIASVNGLKTHEDRLTIQF